MRTCTAFSQPFSLTLLQAEEGLSSNAWSVDEKGSPGVEAGKGGDASGSVQAESVTRLALLGEFFLQLEKQFGDVGAHLEE
ncbi:hypothetical protein P7K49_013293 [Saguinus oedipus]|uniref:Uncharacterized protein n=1 Tax=Saguinus oedipus TaxID=9490 RepID=A0ABQ9VHL6_SAGOE|nr:hypothetical protein P7K49_013293 [Saguinus oedipus]